MLYCQSFSRRTAKILLTCLAFLSLSSFLGLSGCSLLQKSVTWAISRPQVSLTGVTVKKANFSGMALEVGLVIANPNRFALTFSHLNYELRVNEQLLAKGEFEQQLEIPAKGSLSVALPLAVDLSHSLNVLRQFANKASPAEAQWQATAIFDSPVGGFEVSFADKRKLAEFRGL